MRAIVSACMLLLVLVACAPQTQPPIREMISADKSLEEAKLEAQAHALHWERNEWEKVYDSLTDELQAMKSKDDFAYGLRLSKDFEGITVRLDRVERAKELNVFTAYYSYQDSSGKTHNMPAILFMFKDGRWQFDDFHHNIKYNIPHREKLLDYLQQAEKKMDEFLDILDRSYQSTAGIRSMAQYLPCGTISNQLRDVRTLIEEAKKLENVPPEEMLLLQCIENEVVPYFAQTIEGTVSICKRNQLTMGDVERGIINSIVTASKNYASQKVRCVETAY